MRLASGEQDGSRLAWTVDAQDFERTKSRSTYEKRLHGIYLEHHAASRVAVDENERKQKNRKKMLEPS